LSVLSALTPVGLAFASLGAMRVTGPIYSYMFWWCRVLPLPGLVGAGAGLVQLIKIRFRLDLGNSYALARLGAAVALVAVAVPIIHASATGATASSPDSPTARRMARIVESVVANQKTVFTLDVVEPNFWDGPLVLTLVKDGYKFRLDPPMDLYAGDATGPLGGPVFDVGSGGSATQPTTGSTIATSNELTITETR
jgi:hypothetical protein